MLATGASYRRLSVPGEDDYIGAGIHFCATCDGPFYKGAEQIVVVGGGNSACEEGLQAAFIFIGQKPNSEFAQGTMAMDKRGFILTGHDLGHDFRCADGRAPLAFETSMAGMFAAGDVRHGSTQQVASAVGEGAAALVSIREYFKAV